LTKPRHRVPIPVAAVLLVVGQLFLFSPRFDKSTASLWGDLILAAAALLAAVACWFASRTAGPFSKRVWRLVALSLLLRFVHEAVATYYFDFLHASVHTIWPSDVLIFFWAVPAIMTLFLTPRDLDTGSPWLRICDFLQVCTLALALELSAIYVPSRWLIGAQAMENRAFRVGVIFFGLLAVSFLARGFITSFGTVRRLFQRLAVFFVGYGFATNISLYSWLTGSHEHFRLLGLLESVTYGLLSVLAATWNDSEKYLLENASPPSRRVELLAQYSPLLIPAITFPVLLGIAREQFLWTLFLVTISFAAASGRFALLHQQLLVKSRALQDSLSALKLSQERLRIHIEGTPLAVVEWDLEARVTAWNPSAESVFGYSRSEALGQQLDFIVPFQFHHRANQTWHELLARKGGSRSTGQNLTKDGRVITCEWSNTLLVDEAGRILGVASFVQDVTERIALEAKFRQAQKMEAIGRLAGGVAHDFNNLLTIINGYSAMQLERTAPSDSVHHEAEQIKQAGDRAAALTRQLLAFSRHQVLQPQQVNLNDIVRNIDKMLRRLIGEDVEVLTVLAPDLGTVNVDPGQVDQVLMNVVVNARDAMPDGGKLTIQTENVELDSDYVGKHEYAKPGSFILLSVSDSGIGMDAETRARIFEPFFTTKEPGKGTGLGMPMVYGIVKQSGGHIEVDSELSHGTTVKIYLPRVDVPVAEVKPAVERSDHLDGSERIFLVEDDVQLRELVTEILTARGYDVEVIDNIEQLDSVLQRIAACKLLLTDVVMPKMSGPEVAKRLSQHWPGIKVLYMSGYTTDAIVHRGVLDSGLFFLQKPFTPATLAAKVREVLDSPRS